nr:VCBS repeat-containing protein [Desulfobacterales bacterium]
MMKKLFVIFSVWSVIFIMAHANSGVRAQQQGNRLFEARMDFPVGDGPNSVAIGDLNGDGCPDIATANSWSHNVSILLGNGDGTFQTAVNYGVGDGPYSVAIGDLNGDGCPDIAAANYWSHDVSILINNCKNVSHSPRGRVAGPVDAVQYYFFSAMDLSSFAIEDDIASFVGPQGDLTVTGYVWLDERTLEVMFDQQTTVGRYEMVI